MCKVSVQLLNLMLKIDFIFLKILLWRPVQVTYSFVDYTPKCPVMYNKLFR